MLLRRLVQKHAVDYGNAKSRADKADIGIRIVRLVVSQTNGSFYYQRVKTKSQESQNEEMEKLDDEAARRAVQTRLTRAVREAKRPKIGSICGQNDTLA